MGTVNPRARGDETLSSDRRAIKTDARQIRRLLSDIPEPKQQAPSGGYPAGWSRSVANAFAFSAGSAQVLYYTWDFSSNVDQEGGLVANLVPIDTSPAAFGVAESGWYSCSATVQARWTSGAPASAQIVLNPGTVYTSDMAYQNVALVDGEVMSTVSVGPRFWTPGDDTHGRTSLGVTLQLPAGTGAPTTATVDYWVWRVA